MKSINDYKLTDDVTVGQARQWMAKKDLASKESLIKLIHHRFYNRYVKHIKDINSGFLIMAVSCLMIETLESFIQGRNNTKGKGIGLKMFNDFFDREQKLFPEFIEIADEFYSNIRCGILHQAETTNAWRIRRDGVLLDKTNKSINARIFIKKLEVSLDNYIDELKSKEMNSQIWKRALKKIENVCQNCNASR